ncbi:MAG: hypothetical protein ABIH82_05630 [Candidatus Woesearchaeota archaeon]
MTKGVFILNGTIRVKAKDLQAYEKTSKGWKKSNKQFPEINKIVKLFKTHQNFKNLIDTKNPEFLKGQLSPDGNEQGARINILPDGEVLNKAFSLFSNHLTVHDQSTDDHWDVLYQNKGGTWNYSYTLDKIKNHKENKYKKVYEFDKVHKTLLNKVSSALKNKEDHFALPMYTLLTTHMRVGNEIYYRTHGHKGLTTLKKKDISIKGSKVTFNYIGKDGVPICINHEFPKHYVKRLTEHLKPLKNDHFVFTSIETGKPLPEHHFKTAFKQYCGKEFYPHIVRSHYASKQVKDFLKNKHKATKEEVQELYYKIAAELGHKRFSKKENTWKDNYTVTVNSYVQPELVERVNGLIEK